MAIKNKKKCASCGKIMNAEDMFCPACGTPYVSEEKEEILENEHEKMPEYVHDSDKAALKALKTIPGFTPALKGFMNIWNERLFRITNMSSKIKLGNGQMDKYYDMLIPICEKLKIEVPELYMELDVNPNAYTSGDTKPFITLTSGLLETIPDELIPTVLAHECGHIACHHVLYSTMGRMIMNGATFAGGLWGGRKTHFCSASSCFLLLDEM